MHAYIFDAYNKLNNCVCGALSIESVRNILVASLPRRILE